MPPVQTDERKHQSERNGDRDDQGRAHAEQEQSQNHEHQQHAAQQVLLHRFGGLLDQALPVVIRHHLHVGRQHVVVEFLGHGFHAPQNDLRLLADAHQDDAFHGLILPHVSELAEPRRMAYLDLGDVFDVNWNPVLLLQDDIPDIRGIAHQSQAPDVVELSALGIESAAGVGIVITQLLGHLRNSDAIGEQLGGIQQHLILHVGAAKARVVRHALYRAVMALQNPIFDHLQVLRRAIRTLQNIAVDQAAGAE